jgi:hypothetical protein
MTTLHRIPLRLFTWLLLVLFAPAEWSQGGGSGAGNDPRDPRDPTVTSPGEEVTTLPIVDGTSGVTLVGRMLAIREVIATANGNGVITVTRLARRQFAVTFAGDYRIVLRRGRLALGDVDVLFRGGTTFQGGHAVVQIGRSAPVQVPSERVPLPLARIAAAPRAQGTLVALDAFGLGSEHLRLVADFGLRDVTLLQRSF